MQNNKFKFVTHSQTFHLDEVFALALLDIFIFKGNYEVIRTRDRVKLEEYKKDSSAYVVDVGFEYNPEMLNFDHHQSGFEIDGNKNFSSCGLIWKHIKDSNLLNAVMNKETADMVEERLINIVDCQDNGIKVDGADKLEFILMYNRRSSGDNCKKQDHQFKRAVSAAKEYYVNTFSNIRGDIKEEKEALKYVKKSESSGLDNIIVTDSKISDVAKHYNKYPEKMLVIQPHSRGSWIIQSLNIGNKADYSVRCPAPESWGGLEDKSLSTESGIEGMVFCHRNLFLTIIKSDLDGAIDLAKKIILYNQVRWKQKWLYFFNLKYSHLTIFWMYYIIKGCIIT